MDVLKQHSMAMQGITDEAKWDTMQGRQHIAGLAMAGGEHVFAREVLAGCWDHRTDVLKAIAGERFTPKRTP